MDRNFRADVFAGTVVRVGRGSLGRVILPEARNGDLRNAPPRLHDHTFSARPGLVRTALATYES